MRIHMSKAKRYMWGGFLVMVCSSLIIAFIPRDLPGNFTGIMVTVVSPIGIIAGIVMWLYGRREYIKEKYQKKDDGGTN